MLVCSSGRNGPSSSHHDGAIVESGKWWFGTFLIFPYIGNVMIPTDFHIVQRGGKKKPPISSIFTWYFLGV